MGTNRIAILGSGEFAKRLMYYIEGTGFGTITGLFDDFEIPETIKHDRPILGPLGDVPVFFKKNAFDEILIGIGYNHLGIRKKLYEKMKKEGVPFATYIHPSAHVEKSAVVKDGCVILVKCVLDMNAMLEENVFLSSTCFISHDVRIGAHTYCAPALSIAGHTEIGECCFLGINTTTNDNIKIGSNAITSAGSVIINDVSSNVLVAGVPAKIKKTIRKIPVL